jgi:RNA recognition motif-containing protein
VHDSIEYNKLEKFINMNKKNITNEKKSKKKIDKKKDKKNFDFISFELARQKYDLAIIPG